MTPEVSDRIAALTAQGWPAERITKDPIVASAGVSSRTIGRRMQEGRGPVAARASSKRSSAPATPAAPARATAKPATATAPPEAPPVPTSPDDIPEDASLPELADLLRRAKTLLAGAEVAKNLPLAGQMI